MEVLGRIFSIGPQVQHIKALAICGRQSREQTRPFNALDATDHKKPRCQERPSIAG